MKFLTVCVLLALTTCCLAQEARYRHALGFEGANMGVDVGGGGFLKYDFMFKHSPRGFWDLGAAIGGHGFTPELHAYSARTSLGYNLGKKSHFLQLGISGLYTNDYYIHGGYETPRSLHYYAGPHVGYRWISKKRFQFGATIGLYGGTDTYVPYTFSLMWGLGNQ